MNWIKIEDKLPPFSVVVLLYEKKDNKKNIYLGYIDSINVNGNQFVEHKSPNDFASMFGNNKKSNLNPTFWAPIKLPTE